MGKALITNKIYLEGLNSKQFEEIARTLTYKIPKQYNPNASRFSNSVQVEIIKNYKILPKNIIAIPQTRLDLIPEGYQIIDKRVQKLHEFPIPIYPLYDNQQVIYDKIDDNVIINASPGWGKTFTAIYVACKLKQKTLIVVHTLFLRDQWIGAIRNLLGIECGIISSGRINHNSPITVANIQTLNKHLDVLSKEFGTLILDECLDYETLIDTLELGKVKLGALVNQKLKVNVLSRDLTSGVNVYKPVLNYFKNPMKELGLKIKAETSSIKCTKNHSIYRYNIDSNIPEKIAAEKLCVGDYIVQSKLAHKSTNLVNKEWNSILLGMIIGDGNLSYPNKTSKSVRISITHGEAQLEYFNWKLEILASMSPTFSIGKSGFKEANKIYNLNTKSFKDIYSWRTQLYESKFRGNKCKISTSIADILTLESWALIYQDDGSLSGNTIIFSLCELDSQSINNLQQSLYKLFDIRDSVMYTCNKGFNYLRLNSSSTYKFLNNIRNLIHPSMIYKLGSVVTQDSFKFNTPTISIFNEDICIRQIEKIEETTLTNGYRYNIEVEETHNYFANNILVSNCHHIPATTFTKTINSFHARYKIGLSGTLKRKDGKHVLFKDAFGSNVLVAEGNVLTPCVKILDTEFGSDPSLGWADRVTSLLCNPNYQRFISDIAKLYMSMGYCVLILGDRVEFVNGVAKLIGPKCIGVTGKTKDRETIVSNITDGVYDAVSASTSIFAEGISVNRLSMVILANPINNDSLLEQIIARIQRKFEGKLDPVVIDIQLANHSKQNDSRYGFYLRKGWSIETI